MSPIAVSSIRWALLLLLVSKSCLSWTHLEASQVIVWGDNTFGQTNVPPDLTNAVTVAGGGTHCLALKADGTLAGWGRLDQLDVPSGLSNVVAITAGDGSCLALRADGTVVGWGVLGQVALPNQVSNVAAIAAGDYHSLALLRDGTVVGWGFNAYGQTQAPEGLSGVRAITAGYGHSVALRADGIVAAWGGNFVGQTNVPLGLSNVVAIEAGSYHNLALRADGTVTAWGGLNPSSESRVPAGLSEVVAVAAGYAHSVALRADGTLVAWGSIEYSQATIPGGLSNVVAIACGAFHTVALMDSSLELAASLPSGTEDPFFRQTGLMRQRVRVSCSGSRSLAAVRIVIRNLPPNATVYNASGTNALGQPYVQYDLSLAPGASVDLTIEYYAPNRAVPNVTLVGEAVTPAAAIEPTGTVRAIDRSLQMEDGSYLIDFRTLASRTYYVQYSSDLTNWKTAFPPVVASGSGMQWVDNGPPKTDSHPSTQTNRFYRVLLVP